MQSQIVCNGCRTTLLYPRGASNVCCALCNTITPVPPPAPPLATDMAHLICGGCRTLLMYTQGAASVRCSCCHTVNIAPGTGFAHISCANCRTTLMYPFGAPSVRCALCHFVTYTNAGNMRMPLPMHGQSAVPSPAPPSSSTEVPHSQSQTVVVENPMSVDKSGKLVSNVVVGVTMEKK